MLITNVSRGVERAIHTVPIKFNFISPKPVAYSEAAKKLSIIIIPLGGCMSSITAGQLDKFSKKWEKRVFGSF
jgi:hypothetical protein